MDRWFYMEGSQRRGPVSFEELVSAVLSAPAPHRVPVWNEGMAQWGSAGQVSEISQRLPPAPAGGGWSAPLEDAEAIAKHYRRLVLLVGAQLLLSGYFQGQGPEMSQGEAVLALILLPVLLGVTVYLVSTAYRLARYLDAGVPVLWAVAMFIPCLNIIMLLVLSSKAQAWCRQYGIKVGFFGPTKESIEEVRRRGVTSAFD
ncbi:MAG TPA: DUF4339 domain-containing protein [Thermoanaerobaculia bacterium]|nr:DUF4339 domain-containing protein [Thermoanaerobaculia bacterium]